MTERLVLYRVEEYQTAGAVDEWGDPVPGCRGNLHVRLCEEPVSKVTPKGWRLRNGKFVLASASKRWACPTIDEAFVSFFARKTRQAAILENQLIDALTALNAGKRLQAEITAKYRPGAMGWGGIGTASWTDRPTITITNMRESNHAPQRV
jgi:hypothetical protein